jgi:hypothetical protein
VKPIIQGTPKVGYIVHANTNKSKAHRLDLCVPVRLITIRTVGIVGQAR